jgi:hypothetical protein
MNLAPYNKLPAKPEYIAKVLALLEKQPDSRPIDIERKTRLTKTQVMCTLQELLRDEKVKVASENPRRYSLLDNEEF